MIMNHRKNFIGKVKEHILLNNNHGDVANRVDRNKNREETDKYLNKIHFILKYFLQ
jgi:hypothetical protein